LKNSKITPKLHIQHLNEIKEQRNPLSRKGVAALLYFLSDKVGILSESLSVNCKESKTLKQIFETALLEVKDEIGLNSYELTEYSKMK
ncbi:hypothetical protein E3V19_07250, partial [Streptococcus pseudopneumoniae]